MSACADPKHAHRHAHTAAAPAPRRRVRHGLRFGYRTRAALIATFVFGMVVGLGATLAPSAAAPVLPASGAQAAGDAQAVAVNTLRAAVNARAVAAPQLVATPRTLAQQLNPEFKAAHPVRLPFTAGEQSAAAWIADALVAAGFAGDAVTVQEFGLDAVDPLQLVTLELIGAAHAPDAVAVSQNVFVRIAGAEAEAGVIVLGAGYDTFNPAGVAIDPSMGANVSLLIETAQLLQTAQLPQTVYVAFFGGDVVGRVGARHFFNNLPAAAQTSLGLVVNVDAIGAANTLFFTAEVCAGDEICPEQSAAFAAVVDRIAQDADTVTELVLFKEENFDFGNFGECPCCVFNTPDAVVGVPVVTLFAFDFDGAYATAPASSPAVLRTQTDAALSTYQTFLQALLNANRTFN